MWSNHESSPASTSSLWCTVSFAGAVSSLNRIWAHASIVHRRDPSHLLSPHPFPTISFSSPSNHCQLNFCSRLRILAIAITSGPRCDIPPSTKSRHLYAPRRLKLLLVFTPCFCQVLSPFLAVNIFVFRCTLGIPFVTMDYWEELGATSGEGHLAPCGVYISGIFPSNSSYVTHQPDLHRVLFFKVWY
jgi:hypothetical protein